MKTTIPPHSLDTATFNQKRTHLSVSMRKIDKMDYREMLEIQRFAPSDHEFVSGPLKEYFAKRFTALRVEIGDYRAVAISKIVGWGKEGTGKFSNKVK